jgi:hypothetical protein
MLFRSAIDTGVCSRYMGWDEMRCGGGGVWAAGVYLVSSRLVVVGLGSVGPCMFGGDVEKYRTYTKKSYTHATAAPTLQTP